ncbi:MULTISPECIES: hypothetical protein [Anaerolinea]|uniref:hypothetical protein n=1 Tax=Anaerolinea TaxID=233189 RepID=UPI002601A9A3|nr:hypothetical protein [Anaerolinea thermophila]
MTVHNRYYYIVRRAGEQTHFCPVVERYGQARAPANSLRFRVSSLRAKRPQRDGTSGEWGTKS